MQRALPADHLPTAEGRCERVQVVVVVLVAVAVGAAGFAREMGRCAIPAEREAESARHRAAIQIVGVEMRALPDVDDVVIGGCMVVWLCGCVLALP